MAFIGQRAGYLVAGALFVPPSALIGLPGVVEQPASTMAAADQAIRESPGGQMPLWCSMSRAESPDSKIFCGRGHR